eukprot:6199655-Pleurochrysis_carterae.AAC.4
MWLWDLVDRVVGEVHARVAEVVALELVLLGADAHEPLAEHVDAHWLRPRAKRPPLDLYGPSARPRYEMHGTKRGQATSDTCAARGRKGCGVRSGAAGTCLDGREQHVETQVVLVPASGRRAHTHEE